MNRIFSTLTAMAILAAAAFAGPYDAWAKYRDISVNTSAASVAGAVTNYPLLVRLTNANPASGSDVLSDDATGASVRFSSPDGETAYPYEIERWTGTNAEVWVLVPTIAGGTNAVALRMYWGSDTTSASNSAAVFNASTGFVGVWHMDETLASVGNTIADATGQGHTGTLALQAGTNNGSIPANTTAAIGVGKTFTGATGANGTNNANGGYYFNVADPTNMLVLNTNNGSWTISAWANPSVCATNARIAVISKLSNVETNTQNRAWVLQTAAATGAPWNTTVDHLAAFSNVMTSAAVEIVHDGACTVSQWTHVVGRYDNPGFAGGSPATAVATQALKTFVNGTAAVGNAATASHSRWAVGNNAPVHIGRLANSDRYFRGGMDEVRVANVARSNDYITLDHQTQVSGSTIVTLGSTEEQGPAASVPGAPTNVVGTPGSGQVSVAFDAPEDDGGAAITGYTATSSPGDFTGTGATSPIIVTGLTNGVAYTFTVTATNSEGEGDASAPSSSVTPVGVPGAPTGVAGTAGNGQVSVAFTAPGSNGGSAITGYTVTSDPGDFTGTGASSPIIVSGLANGTPYTFTVTATNSEGDGAASAPSSPATPFTVPGAPTNVVATAGSASASVAFDAPAANGAAITNYTVTSSPGDFTGTGAASPIVVSGLSNGVPYTFTVVAANAAGDGAASAPSNAATPAAAPTITYPGGPFSYPTGVRIVNLVPVKGGGPILSYSIDPANITALTNLQFNSVTGIISGTSTMPADQLFVVTAHGVGGSTDTAHVSISTTGPTLSYTGGPFSLPLGVAIEPIRPTKGPAAITGYAIDPPNITALTGLQFNTNTGIISGTPTVTVTGELFVVTANGLGGSTDTAHVIITTTGPTLSYTGGPFSFPLGAAIAPLRPTKGPATITGYAIDPPNITALTGLQFNSVTGIISGTPTLEVTDAEFEVTANGPGGSQGTTEVVITTTGPTLSYEGTPYTLTLGVAIAPIRPAKGPATITGYAIDPPNITALTGLQFNTTTGIISGVPTVVVAALPFEVTAGGLDGTEGTAPVVITTQGQAPVITYPNDGEYDFPLGAAITVLRPTKGGGPIVNYSIAPPDITARTRDVTGGLQFNTNTGAISGTPTKLLEDGDAEAFVVTAHGLGGATGTFDITINTHSTGKMNAGGPLVFRVSGSSMSYTFQVGGEAALEAVTMRIADMSGRTVWSRTVNPSTDGSTGITWDGRAQSGMKAPAGMYIVHVASRADGKTTRVVRKTVTLDAN